MKEIEPGFYQFRAVGIDKNGEMLVMHSYPRKAENKAELRQQQLDFIEKCVSSRGVKEPKITHISPSDISKNFGM